ncbi:MAG TPA: sigma-70 family RNA polymerase sigma factor [Kouleothrix sp.]|uniref:sigma-70 family RNA polymerase sigma factor n=1 Tax=Kouleothrix sp. TaxID=2779161 RepID=UPI002BE775CE|nr:sigma-70 family RNA polymerase sigma factor [Kouleothrix sp.]HRC77807.1 sigma-70 family RNA polymerase sigma factor [Kouleothrix sp.]
MQPHNNSHEQTDGYELFRRAIVERDEQAWAEGAARYRAMLIAWAGRCSASATILDHGGDIADLAFARAWSALTPERFASIPTLAALLAYLRTCVTSAVIDCARSEMQHERIAQALDSAEAVPLEDQVIGKINRLEFWRIARAEVQTEQEQVILVENLMYSLRPAAIMARHPKLFASASQVYAAKRNYLDRLKRNPTLRRLYEEW